MWVVRFKNWHKDCIIRPRCAKYKVTDYVYLLNSWQTKKKFYYTELHILSGEPKNIKKFISDFKKEKSIVKFETEGNWIFTLNVLTGKTTFEYATLFDRRIIYSKPVIQRIDGFEDWELTSWDRDVLMKVMDNSHFDMKLIFIKKMKKADLFLPQIHPDISEKQKKSLNIAIKNGYYAFPRKINLNQLAKIARISKQSFQESLCRAENKLIPYLTS